MINKMVGNGHCNVKLFQSCYHFGPKVRVHNTSIKCLINRQLLTIDVSIHLGHYKASLALKRPKLIEFGNTLCRNA